MTRRGRLYARRAAVFLALAGGVAFTVAGPFGTAAPLPGEGGACSQPCEVDRGRVFSGWNVGDLACFEDEVVIGNRADAGSPYYYRCLPADDLGAMEWDGAFRSWMGPTDYARLAR